jgi:Holliday junction resolvase RusA-like endonuclease
VTIAQGTLDGSLPIGGELVIEVRDMPRPQGSKVAFKHRHTGNVVTVESGRDRVRTWREAIKEATVRARLLAAHDRLDGPVSVTVTFTLPRPKSHYRTGRNAHLLRDSAPRWPTSGADVDKLLRATLDALTAAGVWADDKQVVHATAWEVFPTSYTDALDVPGAVIRIRGL